MNSVHLYVLDACGTKHLSTFAANTPEQVAAFRKHASQCKQYWKSAEYRQRVPAWKQPVFPVTVCADAYEDQTS